MNQGEDDAPNKTLAPTAEELVGWPRICYRELSILFDSAHEGLVPFIEHELEPLGRNLLRGLDLRSAGFDLAALGFYAVDRARGVERPLILPSEQALSRAMSRWSLSPESVDLFLERTFDLVGDALARRHGHVVASELIQEAVDIYRPVRHEALRRLITGPTPLRPALWPTRYLAAPALWSAASLISGVRVTGAEKTARRVVLEALERAGVDTSRLRPPKRRLRRLALGAALSLLGAAVGSTAAYHAAHTLELYTAQLNDIEDILLLGFAQSQPEVTYGEGLLSLLERLQRYRPEL